MWNILVFRIYSTLIDVGSIGVYKWIVDKIVITRLSVFETFENYSVSKIFALS